MTADTAAAGSTASRTVPFVFTGKAKEYFSIWIVNVALTILTLGVYSAWAKVRTSQYFYGNTYLDDASFRYLAEPLQILRGRLVAFVLLVAYYFSGLISPKASAIIMMAILVLFPAFLVMSMAFRLRNSAWRNVRFGFQKKFGRAYAIFTVPALLLGAMVFAGSFMVPEQAAAMNEEELRESMPPAWLVLVPMLLWFLSFPLFEYLLARFRVVHARYGAEDFGFHANAGSYYWMYIAALFVMLLAVIVVSGAMAVTTAALGAFGMLTTDAAASRGAHFIPLILFVVALPFYLWVFAFFQARRTNLVFNNIEVAGHRLQSDLRVADLLGLYFTNTLAILLSLGLLIPWAKVRTARYRASRTGLLAHGDLGEFSNVQRERQSAMGEEIGDMLDLDLGF